MGSCLQASGGLLPPHCHLRNPQEPLDGPARGHMVVKMEKWGQEEEATASRGPSRLWAPQASSKGHLPGAAALPWPHTHCLFLPRAKLDPKVTRDEKALSASPETR